MLNPQSRPTVATFYSCRTARAHFKSGAWILTAAIKSSSLMARPKSILQFRPMGNGFFTTRPMTGICGEFQLMAGKLCASQTILHLGLRFHLTGEGLPALGEPNQNE